MIVRAHEVRGLAGVRADEGHELVEARADEVRGLAAMRSDEERGLVAARADELRGLVAMPILSGHLRRSHR